jgi:signal transduction histidine kinase
VENGACQGPGGTAAAATSAAGGLLADAGGGHGLEAMRARAQRAGGTARSGPHDGGWLVELEVPA